MSRRLEIRDPVHGFIYREPHEQKVIDTPVFQRLRRLKQLALAHLVYPGAVHTRFDHSLGVLQVARRVSSKLLGNAEAECRLIRLSALLHDIGHAPFSHVSEPILQEFSGGELKLEEGQQVHELITSDILMQDPDLEHLLSEDEREQIVALLRKEQGYSVFKEIISGPLDADKQDYLLRDSHFCGVKYGIYDLDRLINTLELHEDPEDKYLALAYDGLHSVEQFVLAKYYMHTQVYSHRVRIITDKMIERGISLGIKEDKVEWLAALYNYKPTPEYLQEYLSWHDDKLVTEILSTRTSDGYVKTYFRRLNDRRLFRKVFSASENDFPDPEIRLAVLADNKALLKQLEAQVATYLKEDPNFVIANIVRFKPATRTESDIMVLHPSGPRIFRDVSALFRSVNQSIQEQYIEVYAPCEYKDDKDRNRKKSQFHGEILAMLNEVVKNELKKEGQS